MKIQNISQRLKRVVRIVLLGILVICIAGGASVLYVFKTTKPYPIDLDGIRLELTGTANAAIPAGSAQEDAALINRKSRVWVDLSKVPKNLTNAIVSTEDKSFYTNDGVDYRRTLEAAANEVFHFFKTEQGASTITQQIVKNIEGNMDNRSYENKLKEIVTAIDITGKYSKDQIMEIYVNIVTLGDNCYGVQAASELYFKKDVSELDLAQCATLAAILPSPNLIYNPYKNPENLNRRRGLVLKNMHRQGMITEAQYNQAIHTAVTFLGEEK